MGDKRIDSLYHQYGEDAVVALIYEVKKHPILYKTSPRRINHPSRELKGAQKDAWMQVMKALMSIYGEVSETIAWTTWRVLYVHYGTTNGSKKWQSQLSFLDGCKRTIAKKRKSQALVQPKKVNVERRETPEHMEELCANPAATTTQQRNTLSALYGGDACSHLIDEVGKYPVIYNQILMHYKYAEELPKDVRDAWKKVMEAMDAKYPGVPEELAFRAWRTIQINYKKVNCPKKYAGKITFLNNVPRRKRYEGSNVIDVSLLLPASSEERETIESPTPECDIRKSPNQLLQNFIHNSTIIHCEPNSAPQSAEISPTQELDSTDFFGHLAEPVVSPTNIIDSPDPFKKVLEYTWKKLLQYKDSEANLSCLRREITKSISRVEDWVLFNHLGANI
uniref:MADF domain-containing protein n=1 Tax=Steinernema glaseri TaxID=37863 RepID=A0A1I7ZMQ8_9BILA